MRTLISGVITIPIALLIEAITQSYPMVVTIGASNTYVVNQCVRFNIPPVYGMQQANGLTGAILSISGLNFSIDIDSTLFDIFAIPNPSTFPVPTEPATLAPAGSRNLEFNNFTGFEPFQSLNNIGN